MGKRGSDCALLKRPASNASSIEGELSSEVAVAELEGIGNIDDLRKRARKLGLVTQHRNSDGQWCHCTRADILDEYRRRLEELHGPALGPVPPAVRSSLACGNDATGEAQVSVLSADDLNSIRDIDAFRKAALKLGLTVQVKSGDGKGYTRRRKADIVKEYRQQLAESQRSSGSALGPSSSASVQASVTSSSSLLS